MELRDKIDMSGVTSQKLRDNVTKHDYSRVTSQKWLGKDLLPDTDIHKHSNPCGKIVT